MNIKIGREIIHSPIIKLFKNINGNSNTKNGNTYNNNNNNNSVNMSVHHPSENENLDSSSFMNSSAFDRTKSFAINQNNNIL